MSGVLSVTVIEIPSGEVHFTAGDGQANVVTVSKLSGPAHVYRFSDTVRTGTGAGSPGNYTTGGAGNDVIYSRPGDEYISGGSGVDTVSCVGRWNPITAVITGTGGEAGESGHHRGTTAVYVVLRRRHTVRRLRNRLVLRRGRRRHPCRMRVPIAL